VPITTFGLDWIGFLIAVQLPLMDIVLQSYIGAFGAGAVGVSRRGRH